MRIATLIISMVLMLVLGLQSLAVAVGGSISEDLSTTAADKQEAQDLAGAGALGMLAALLWLVGAALVLGKPKASVWLFSSAGVFCLIGGGAGFSDLFIWAVVSVVFAALSWLGTREKARDEQQKRDRYAADVQAAAAAQWQPQAAVAQSSYAANQHELWHRQQQQSAQQYHAQQQAAPAQWGTPPQTPNAS